MTKPIICVNCAFCLHIPDPRRKHSDNDWYDYRCSAVVNDKKIDFVTGKEAYATHEAGFLTEDKHPNCKDMNTDGKCTLFEIKQ